MLTAALGSTESVHFARGDRRTSAMYSTTGAGVTSDAAGVMS